MKVMKFGGTSVRDYERMCAVADLVVDARREGPVAVVVSALSGVTNTLHAAAAASQQGDADFAAFCDELNARHNEVVDALESEAERSELRLSIGKCVGELKMILAGVSLVHECTPRTLDKILASGERLSSPLVAAVLRQKGVEAEACDARALIVTDRGFGNANVKIAPTYKRIREHFQGRSAVQVVTGFLSATPEGETTTLGRGASDYTASLLGGGLEAERIEIWTDVDGVQSADPRRVTGAFSIPRLSYDELLELSHFGAKVVAPPTVHPARRASIPLVIKNTLNPSFEGTLVLEEAGPSEHPIRGISSISKVALLRIEGDGMIGLPGTAGRLFHALAQEGVTVILISQASSQHSICVAIDPCYVEQARECIHREFERERHLRLIDDLVIDEDFSVVAVVGAEMSHRPGISGRLFAALGEAGINVGAIAQGSSELNISCAVPAREETRALQTLHDAFFATPRLNIFLLGVGGVGAELLSQLREAPVSDGLSLSGIANSRRMSLDRQRIDRSTWNAELLDTDDCPGHDPEALKAYILATPGARVLVDCTASDGMGALYADLLRGGVSIVTANKRPLADRQAVWDEIVAAQSPSARLYCEATVGAGLPVIRTLQDQLATGDRLVRAEGLFSGTLGFLMHQLRGGAPFSEALRAAHLRGITEPDPREDLSGMDVARKLIILARVGGARLELEDLELQSLLPAREWEELELEQLWERLPELDAHFAALANDASKQDRRLTYLASWDGARATVGLDTVGIDHPVAATTETENLFSFVTERYSESPLVVRGPGAGTAVTAAGVFADILACSVRRSP